jgi:hypothetical protein
MPFARDRGGWPGLSRECTKTKNKVLAWLVVVIARLNDANPQRERSGDHAVVGCETTTRTDNAP